MLNLESMPIYEYYCAVCEGRFRHLAKHIDAPPPPCPRCGTTAVTRLISTANVIHGEKHHARQFQEAATQVDSDDQRAIARFLQQSGRLEEAEGVYGSPSYRELLARRAEGATDAEVADLVDDLAAQMHPSEATQMAGAVAFSDHVENRMSAAGPPEHREDSPADAHTPLSPRAPMMKDLGWG